MNKIIGYCLIGWPVAVMYAAMLYYQPLVAIGSLAISGVVLGTFFLGIKFLMSNK